MTVFKKEAAFWIMSWRQENFDFGPRKKIKKYKKSFCWRNLNTSSLCCLLKRKIKNWERIFCVIFVFTVLLALGSLFCIFFSVFTLLLAVQIMLNCETYYRDCRYRTFCDVIQHHSCWVILMIRDYRSVLETFLVIEKSYEVNRIRTREKLNVFK